MRLSNETTQVDIAFKLDSLLFVSCEPNFETKKASFDEDQISNKRDQTSGDIFSNENGRTTSLCSNLKRTEVVGGVMQLTQQMQ